tara:strand:- start:42 stop:284 length:243 start_codon:yes stop_codon:yes gene_type:complete
MKKQHLFTLDIDLVKRLHKKVPRGSRSQFVERAIKNKLNNEEEFFLEDVQTLPILLELTYRVELPKSAKMYLQTLYQELM